MKQTFEYDITLNWSSLLLIDITIASDISEKRKRKKQKWHYTEVQPFNHPEFEQEKSFWHGNNALFSWSWKGCEWNEAKVEIYFI